MEIQHPLHDHPLKLVPVGPQDDDDGATVPVWERGCAGCDDELSGEVYACDPCNLYLHQSCAFLPQRIDNFIHPGCPLFLKESQGRGEPHGMMMLWYRCEPCNFGIDATCGHKFIQPKHSGEDGILGHISHKHPLKLHIVDADGKPSSEEEVAGSHYCRRCYKLIISGNYYSCSSRDCGYYYIHESCVGHLPRKVRHFFHPCILSLQEASSPIECGACPYIKSDVLLYHCQSCDFGMHVECAKYKLEDEGKNVMHWTHHHPLRLSEETEEEEILRGRILICGICAREISGQRDYAACELCRFYIHKSCMDLPWEIQHRCHPHPLRLEHTLKRFTCNTCLKRHISSFSYQCKKCLFDMDVKCALFSQQVVAQGDNTYHILHFCHQHPLQLFKDPKKDKTDLLRGRELKCLVCTSSVSGLTYGCKECDVSLHKSCLDILPQTLHMADASLFLNRAAEGCCTKCGHPFRDFHFRGDHRSNQECWCIPCALLEALSIRVSPDPIRTQLHFHSCSLTLKLFPTFTCNACFTHCNNHAYNCDQCDFYVGLKCAQMSMQSIDDGEEWIRHFCHWHPLQPSQDTEVTTAACKICGSICTPGGAFYFCSDCDFHIHTSCLDILPQKIDKHYFNCSLVLLTSSSYRCIACQEENSSGLTFRSIQGRFNLCMKCVIRPENKHNDDGTFTSIHHWHRLELSQKLEKDASCLLCKAKVSTSAYYCSQCNYYFHKACAELPFLMQHPLHKQHSLTLISSHRLPKSSRNCSLCKEDLLSFYSHHSGVYHCKECGFNLDRKCANCFPSIQYEGHPHLLTVVENMQGQEVCHVCSTSCTDKMVFRCAEAECKFTLHLSCGPLPCKIKHSCHVHPLILEDFHVEENYTDLFPCHVCEKRRDPRLPVYCCTEGCPMICEIKCVISEVMPKLLGTHGDVELRTTFPNVVSKVITKDEGLINITYDSRTISSRHVVEDYMGTRITGALEFFLSGNVEGYINFAISRWEYEMLRSNGIELEREDEGLFKFTKEAFGYFSSRLECTHLTLGGEGTPDFILQHGGPAVGGEYILTESLIPIYEECFGKTITTREIISPYSEGKTFKSYFVFMLCTVFHNMRTTKLVDVTNERVLQWLTMMKLVEEAGFDIGFISDKMKRVWEAHFLIKAKAIVDDKSARLGKRREHLARIEKELLMQLEDTRREMEEVKQEEERHHKYAGDGMRSLRKEYADALLIKWKPASAAVLDCKDQRRHAIFRWLR